MSLLPKVILVPTDFGDPSEAALDCAIEYATKLGSDIVLMHAYEIPIMGFPDGAMVATAEITARLLEAAQIGLDRQVRARADAGVRIHGIVKQGDPYRMVNETATEVGAGLIVMGTHGRKGLSRALLGSVAEKVVRTARIPVLTVHPGESKAAPHATGAAPRATETSDVNAASRPPISGSPASSRTP